MSNATEDLGLANSLSDSRNTDQLFAAGCEPFTRPILLVEGYDYPRGCVVYAADQNAEFARVKHGSLPAVTDVVGVVSESIDLTDASDAIKHTMYIGPADFTYDALGMASADDLTLSDWNSLIEVMIAKGMNVRKMAYGQFVPAA